MKRLISKNRHGHVSCPLCRTNIKLVLAYAINTAEDKADKQRGEYKIL